MNLILLDPREVESDGAATLTDARAVHVVRVLNAAPGQSIRVGVVDGPRGTATVASVGEGRVNLRCAFDADIPPRPVVHLLLALPRPKVMRRLWAQLAAIGVGRILLTNAARVERNYFDTHVLGEDCYRPLLLEGLQQAQDTHLPCVTVHRRFKVLVEDELDALLPTPFRVVAQPGRAHSVGVAIRARGREGVLLAVGPEGGWTDFETALLEGHGFQAVDMGPRTLRTDTACLALLALVHDALRPA